MLETRRCWGESFTWIQDYLGDTATLNVHVCWLRTKIEDDPSTPRYLRTVRGVGYRFDVPDAIAQGRGKKGGSG